MDAFHKKENSFTLSFQTEFELFKIIGHLFSDGWHNKGALTHWLISSLKQHNPSKLDFLSS